MFCFHLFVRTPVSHCASDFVLCLAPVFLDFWGHFFAKTGPILYIFADPFWGPENGPNFGTALLTLYGRSQNWDHFLDPKLGPQKCKKHAPRHKRKRAGTKRGTQTQPADEKPIRPRIELSSMWRAGSRKEPIDMWICPKPNVCADACAEQPCAELPKNVRRSWKGGAEAAAVSMPTVTCNANTSAHAQTRTDRIVCSTRKRIP